MRPRADNVAAFARAYGVPVLEALVAGGVLTPAEAKARVAIRERADLTDDELLDEIAARLRRGRTEDPDAQAAPMTKADYSAVAYRPGRRPRPGDDAVIAAAEEEARRVRRGEEPQR